jgi:hypothetical protein
MPAYVQLWVTLGLNELLNKNFSSMYLLHSCYAQPCVAESWCGRGCNSALRGLQRHARTACGAMQTFFPEEASATCAGQPGLGTSVVPNTEPHLYLCGPGREAPVDMRRRPQRQRHWGGMLGGLKWDGTP